jgi:hypothetical protein
MCRPPQQIHRTFVERYTVQARSFNKIHCIGLVHGTGLRFEAPLAAW